MDSVEAKRMIWQHLSTDHMGAITDAHNTMFRMFKIGDSKKA